MINARKSDLTDKMKRSFFQAAIVSILLYGCTTWTLTKRPEKRLDGNYTRMLWAIYTGPRGSTPQSSSCTATYHPSRKLSKLDKPDMHNTAGEVGTSSLVMYSYGPLHMAKKSRATILNIHTAALRIRGVALRTCPKRWTIGRSGERGSGISVLMAQ